ncbi:MAG: polysaccharide deacetylase family protein [Lachnospiraceae bacterium]|nr:polysaccharide deacetylase family protein [Lachnospiraceae bacterium]
MEGFSEYEGAECELLIDYEDGGFGQLWSVLFRVEREIDGVKEYAAVPWVYNKKKGEAVDAETLFGERTYTYVAEKVNETAEQEEAKEITVSYYLLTADGIRFFYETDGSEASITIPYSAVHTYMAVTVGGTVIAETIRELDPDKPMIALTFDDGPHYKNTPRLLQILEENKVHVTFFLLGERTGWNGSPEVVRQIAASGNEIASHTHNHKMLGNLSVEELIAEIADAREAIYALTGDYPTFVRPPYGNYSDTVKKYADAPLITWNLDSEDWKTKNTDSIIKQVLSEAGDGKIVLCHDIHTCTIDAMEVLIPELMNRGYQIVTVRELYYYKGVELENGRVYHSSYN